MWTVPAQMKKDRPGVVLHALVRPETEAAAVGLLLVETGTLGSPAADGLPVRGRPGNGDGRRWPAAT